MKKKAILVGTGSWGEWWCKYFLPPNIEDGLIEVVAVADKNPQSWECAKKWLHLSEEQCFTSAREAFQKTDADFCIIVVDPAHHEEIVDCAIEYKLDILSEKPIADSLEGAIRIHEKVKRAGLKMGVTMSHRFDQDKTTLREEIKSGRWGKLNYLISRFTCDCRKFGSWGELRHLMKHPLLLEGAVHHLDILADLTGSLCESIYARTWKPSWGQFQGDCNALITMNFENGMQAFYEGAKSNAVTLNKWAHEYFRAECENGTLILNQRKLEVFPYNPETSWAEGEHGKGKSIDLLEQDKWANAWLVEKFVSWLEGKEPMETSVENNIQAMVLIFAAVESAHTNQVVKVQDYWKRIQTQVIATMQKV